MSVRTNAVLGLAALAGLGLALLSPVAAGDGKTDKKGSNTQETPKGTKLSAKSKALRNLEFADEMIRYGRQEKCAECLLMAAQILHKTPSEPLKSERTVTGGKEGTTAKAAKTNNTPKGLVAEAKKMSSTPQTEALAMATEKGLQEDIRGAVGGPRVDNFTIGAFQIINWNPIDFRAGEQAEVYINTGVFSVMTLEIRDENGVLIARDNIAANFYRCVWTPKWTGSFRIRLINNDNLAFNCILRTN